MARWVKFTADYDHRWPSRAVTAFKEGMICYVKNAVADRATDLGRAEETEKPDDDERVATPSEEESERDGD